MNAVALIETCQRQGIQLSTNGDKLHVKAPDRASLSPELLDRLRAEKPRLMPLLRACAEACLSLDNVKAPELLAALAPEDISELQALPDPRKFLGSFALALSATRWRQLGISPPWWTSPAHCDRCGPVYLWASISVAGCPWCWNRRHGLPIPRPVGRMASCSVPEVSAVSCPETADSIGIQAVRPNSTPQFIPHSNSHAEGSQ